MDYETISHFYLITNTSHKELELQKVVPLLGEKLKLKGNNRHNALFHSLV